MVRCHYTVDDQKHWHNLDEEMWRRATPSPAQVEPRQQVPPPFTFRVGTTYGVCRCGRECVLGMCPVRYQLPARLRVLHDVAGLGPNPKKCTHTSTLWSPHPGWSAVNHYEREGVAYVVFRRPAPSVPVRGSYAAKRIKQFKWTQARTHTHSHTHTRTHARP